MTWIVDLALNQDAPHGDVFNAIEAINATQPNGHRIVFMVSVSHVGTPQRMHLFLEPETTPADVEELHDLLEAWTHDGQLRTTPLTRADFDALPVPTTPATDTRQGHTA